MSNPIKQPLEKAEVNIKKAERALMVLIVFVMIQGVVFITKGFDAAFNLSLIAVLVYACAFLLTKVNQFVGIFLALVSWLSFTVFGMIQMPKVILLGSFFQLLLTAIFTMFFINGLKAVRVKKRLNNKKQKEYAKH